MDQTDEELVQRYRAGDQGALSTLIERHLSFVFGFILRRVGNREEAEDIVQETFLKAWTRIRTFDEGKTFKTWLFTIARNTAIDRLRKKKTLSIDIAENESGETFAQTFPDTDPLPDDILESALRADTVNEAIEKLSPDQREILILHYREELSLNEIAGILKLSINTVKSRDRRALLALRKILAPEKSLDSY